MTRQQKRGWPVRETIDQVREFHDAFGVVNHSQPTVTNPAINLLRIKLIREELDELEQALAAGDVVETLDALTDLQYVLDGAYLQLGFANVKSAAFNEVHRSNMSKLGPDGKPIRREDGKVLKGAGYTPPYLVQFVEPIPETRV